MPLTRTALTFLCLLCLALTAVANNDDDEPKRSIFDWFYTQEDIREVVAYAKTKYIVLKSNNCNIKYLICFGNLSN